jgi:acyl carrier protein
VADHAFWEAVQDGDVATAVAELGLSSEVSSALGAVLPTLSAWRRRQSWWYRTVWEPLGNDGTTRRATGTWLVPTFHDSEVGDCVEALARAGARPVVVRMSSAPTGDEESASVLGAAFDEHPVIDGVLAPATTPALADRLLRALRDTAPATPVWIATRGAYALTDDEVAAEPRAAAVRGFVLGAAQAEPGRRIGLMDLPLSLDERAQAHLASVLPLLPTEVSAGAVRPERCENHLAVRSSGSFARRLLRAPFAHRARVGGDRSGGTVLVVGGLRGLGADAARQWAQRGAGHLVLGWPIDTGASGTAGLEAELSGAGVKVTTGVWDPDDPASLADLCALLPDGRPLDAVVLAPDPLDTHADHDRALASAVGTAHALDELTRPHEGCAFTVLMAAGTVPGDADPWNSAVTAVYQAAVQRRQAAGLHAAVASFGARLADGAAAGEAVGGVRPVVTRLALAALPGTRDDGGDLLVTDVEWETFASVPASAPLTPLLRRLLPDAPATTPEGPSAPQLSFLEQFTVADDGQRGELVRELVLSCTTRSLGLTATDTPVDPHQNFLDLGFSSVAALQLRNELATATGVELPPAVVYDHPTPDSLADYLSAALTE